MATGGDMNCYVCSVCLEEGQTTEATSYCVDCDVYFCTPCVKFHKFLKSMKSHQINDVDVDLPSDYPDAVDVKDNPGENNNSAEHGSDAVQGIKCTLHQDKYIDLYCYEHDEVCCGDCAVVKHRSCTTTSISIASKDFKSSGEILKHKVKASENITQCRQEIDRRTINRGAILKQKQESIEKVDRHEEALIAKVKELAAKSRQEIRSKYDEHKSGIENGISTLTVLETTNLEYFSKLDHTDDAEDLFLYVKMHKTVPTDGEQLLNSMIDDWEEKQVLFSIDPKLGDYVLGTKSFGQFEERSAKEYEVNLETSISVKQENDYESHIFDMCFMDRNSNSMLLADHHNKSLKRLNYNLKFKDKLTLSGRPIAVCKVDKNEAAVRIWDTGKVHLISVGESMQITSTFEVAAYGYGITCDTSSGEIFACEGGSIGVYSKTGTRLKTHQYSLQESRMFSVCTHIALSEDKQCIYLTDRQFGLIVLNKDGTIKMKVPVPRLGELWPLCLLPGHVCLVGSKSGAIIQINTREKRVKMLIESKSSGPKTWCAIHDKMRSQLIVGRSANMIDVYKLSVI